MIDFLIESADEVNERTIVEKPLKLYAFVEKAHEVSKDVFSVVGTVIALANPLLGTAIKLFNGIIKTLDALEDEISSLRVSPKGALTHGHLEEVDRIFIDLIGTIEDALSTLHQMP